MKRATVYFEEDLYKAIKMKSAEKLEKTVKKDRIQIVEKIPVLAKDPRSVGSKKLS